MATIRIKPKNMEPFEITGQLTSKIIAGKVYYYINGESFPAEIVEVVSE